MPKCQGCKEEADDLVPFKVEGKRKKLCEDCLEIAEEQAEIAEMGESAMQDMMGYKGRR
ncbi:MAG: hypothetical protein ACI9KE_000075 [Polyangiales bacterium]|jgi:hypothetical protein